MPDNYESPLKIAKNLGSVKQGAHHWLHQRLTSIILLPLTIWGIFFLKKYITLDACEVPAYLQAPYNLVPLILFILMSYYHASLGMQVVLEDYIKNTFLRNSLIFLIKIISLITVIALITGLFNLKNV